MAVNSDNWVGKFNDDFGPDHKADAAFKGFGSTAGKPDIEIRKIGLDIGDLAIAAVNENGDLKRDDYRFAVNGYVNVPGHVADGHGLMCVDQETGVVDYVANIKIKPGKAYEVQNTGMSQGKIDELLAAAEAYRLTLPENDWLRVGSRVPIFSAENLVIKLFEVLGIDGMTGKVDVRIKTDKGITNFTFDSMQDVEKAISFNKKIALLPKTFKLWKSKFVLDEKHEWAYAGMDRTTGEITVIDRATQDSKVIPSIDHLILEFESVQYFLNLKAKHDAPEHQKGQKHESQIPISDGTGGLVHAPYSSRYIDAGMQAQLDAYERPIIGSSTEKVNRGMFMPPSLFKKQEAIVVDTSKDEFLGKYVSEFINILRRIGEVERLTPEFILELLADKIGSYKYCDAMSEDITKLGYVPGKKYLLGVMMQNNHMVCRHMALLSAIIMEKIMDDPDLSKVFPTGTTYRFMAEMENRAKDKKMSGHAYLVVTCPNGAEAKYFALDSTHDHGERLLNFSAFLNNPELAAKYQRYLYSLFRLVFDRAEAENNGLLLEVFMAATSNRHLRHAVRDALKDVSGKGQIYFKNLRKSFGFPEKI